MLFLAVFAGGQACVREEIIPETALREGLQILPRLLQEAVTKAKDEQDPDIAGDDEVAARDDLRENYFRSLDVFVKRQADADTAPWFKEYHLEETAAGAGMEQIEYLLANNWAREGYVPNEKYDIYATANNPHTASGIANLSQLKALTTTKIHLYQYYAPSDPGNGSNYITIDDENGILHKNFLMDGKIEGWEIDPNKSKQLWDMELSRAAAKILVLVRFDGDSQNVMIADEETNEPQLDGEGRAVYGSLKDYLAYNKRSPGLPRAKYVRFNFTTSDIADGSYEPLTQDLVTDAGNFVCIKEHGSEVKNVDDQYVVATYCYPFTWGDQAERIPYLLLSVFYSKDDDPGAEQTRSYYRIPVCDEESVTGLERNKIYVVDVLLSSMGSSNASVEAQDEEVRIEYHVIPWTETNMTQEATTVRLSDTKYLMVTPLEYTLKGDGVQRVDLQYFASVSTDDGRFVDIDQNSVAITYVNKDGATTNIKGTVSKTPASPDGTTDIVYTFTAPTNTANGEKVTIRVTPSGIIRVDSEALDSRAVKTISFDVQLYESGLDKEHVVIRHFPLDNIQSIEGSWSSRWDGVDNSIEYSYNPTADGWASWDGYDDDVEVSQAQYNSASDGKRTTVTSEPTGTPSDYDTRSDIESGGNNSDMQTAFRDVVPQGSRQGATEANAYHDTATDYWYWGTGQTNGSNANYDWSSGWLNRTYYRWTTYNRRKYFKNTTHYYARRYYRTSTSPSTPDTGSWVAWGEKNGTTNAGIFTAKVYYNGNCYEINNSTTRGSRYDNLTNNHMYVIQITSTSDTYALGRPVLDENYQSQDRVASPAFMIASQLGAVTTTNNPVTASTHCGTYMEVGTDGKRYVGWRLPTKQEIEVIIGYQDGTFTSGITMVTVLGGQYYWALDGTSAIVSSGSGGSATTAYVRCVRDLSVEEVEQLNQ